MASAGSVTVSPYQNGAQSITTTGAVSAGATTVTSLTDTGALSIGATPATAGAVRLAKVTTVNARNNGNTANIALLATDASDNFNIGDATNAANTILRAATGVRVYTNLFLSDVDGTVRLTTSPSATTTTNVSSGTSLDFQYNATSRFKIDSVGVGFLGATPVARQAITGALSTVTDAAAKAVLTSIVTAGVNLGLFTNSTT